MWCAFILEIWLILTREQVRTEMICFYYRRFQVQFESGTSTTPYFLIQSRKSPWSFDKMFRFNYRFTEELRWWSEPRPAEQRSMSPTVTLTINFAHVSSPPCHVGNYISIQSPHWKWLTTYIHPFFSPIEKKNPFKSCSLQRFNCRTQRVSQQAEKSIFRVFQVSITRMCCKLDLRLEHR